MGIFVPRTCPACHGSGEDWRNNKKPCKTCEGRGNVTDRELKDKGKK